MEPENDAFLKEMSCFQGTFSRFLLDIEKKLCYISLYWLVHRILILVGYNHYLTGLQSPIQPKQSGSFSLLCSFFVRCQVYEPREREDFGCSPPSSKQVQVVHLCLSVVLY